MTKKIRFFLTNLWFGLFLLNYFFCFVQMFSLQYGGKAALRSIQRVFVLHVCGCDWWVPGGSGIDPHRGAAMLRVSEWAFLPNNRKVLRCLHEVDELLRLKEDYVPVS